MRCTRDHNSCFITRYNIIENVLLLRDQHLERKTNPLFVKKTLSKLLPRWCCFEDLKTGAIYPQNVYYSTLAPFFLSFVPTIGMFATTTSSLSSSFASSCGLSFSSLRGRRVLLEAENVSSTSRMRRPNPREKARREIERRRRRDVSFFSFRRDEEENPTADV